MRAAIIFQCIERTEVAAIVIGGGVSFWVPVDPDSTEVQSIILIDESRNEIGPVDVGNVNRFSIRRAIERFTEMQANAAHFTEQQARDAAAVCSNHCPEATGGECCKHCPNMCRD